MLNSYDFVKSYLSKKQKSKIEVKFCLETPFFENDIK